VTSARWNWITNTDTGGLTILPRTQEGQRGAMILPRLPRMKYTQPYRQYHVSVLTDSPYSTLPPDIITPMRYDRQTDGWVAIRPSKIIYPKAKQLVAQYRREQAEG